MSLERWSRLVLGLAILCASACGGEKNAAGYWGETTIKRTSGRRFSGDDFETSPEKLVKGCQNADEKSCADLADLYLLSISTPHLVDYDFTEEAIRSISRWWAKTRQKLETTCRGGDAAACFDAFGMWLVSEFDSYDESKAFELMTRGCDLGSAASCDFLGAAWRNGYPSVLEKDEVKSREAYKRACDLGNFASCRK